MATYRGKKIQRAGPRVVTKDGEILSPARSQKIWNHSPDGFQWGYGGSGPAQLALALLLDVTGDKELASRWHQQFKWDVVARWGDEWKITSEQIKEWIKGTENVAV